MSNSDVADGGEAAASETGEDRPTFLDTTHPASWSANLEGDRYADDRETLVEHALAAIEQTRAGYHVNLVTHPNHDSPDAYLEASIRENYPDAETTVVDQCGCGGYVYRVTL
jgi:putative CGCGG family rSAM target protein